MYGCTLQIYNGFTIGEFPNEVEMKEIKMSEIFEGIEGIKDIDRSTLHSGPYPLVSSSGTNNSIIDYVDKYNYEGIYISFARSGTVGSCFVQTGKFEVLNHSTGLIKLKEECKYLESCLGLLAYIMTNKFTRIYNYSTLLNNSRLMKETISLPTLDGKINENLLNAYVYEMMLI